MISIKGALLAAFLTASPVSSINSELSQSLDSILQLLEGKVGPSQNNYRLRLESQTVYRVNIDKEVYFLLSVNEAEDNVLLSLTKGGAKQQCKVRFDGGKIDYRCNPQGEMDDRLLQKIQDIYKKTKQQHQLPQPITGIRYATFYQASRIHF